MEAIMRNGSQEWTSHRETDPYLFVCLMLRLVSLLAVQWGCGGGQVKLAGEDADIAQSDPDTEGEGDKQLRYELAKFALEPAKTCEDVTHLWREAARANMMHQLDNYKYQMLNPDTCHHWEDWGYPDS